MGKGKNKNREVDDFASANHNPKNKPNRHDHDEEYDSDASMSTHLTFDDDMSSVQGDLENHDEDTFLETLSQHIENAGHKNNSVRLAALRHLQFSLTSHYLGEFVTKWRSTLIDLITKGVRKTDEEVVVCASLLGLVAIQIGDESSEEIEEALGVLRVILADPTKSDVLRAHCCLCLAITTYLASQNDDGLLLSIKALRQAWMSTKLTAQSSKLFANSVAAWALLLQNVESQTVITALQDEPKLVTYLESTNADIRVAAGEALALLYELAETVRPGTTFPNHNHVLELLRGLCNVTGKAKAKREKRVQKLTFRQILAYISQGEAPELKVKFTNSQTLFLESCWARLIYDLCTDLLRGGMMRHLRDNQLLREIFDLGAPEEEPEEKMRKATRQAVYDTATKYRQQQRSKMRDRRAGAAW